MCLSKKNRVKHGNKFLKIKTKVKSIDLKIETENSSFNELSF